MAETFIDASFVEAKKGVKKSAKPSLVKTVAVGSRDTRPTSSPVKPRFKIGYHRSQCVDLLFEKMVLPGDILVVLLIL